VNSALNLFISYHEKVVGSAERRFGTGWENLFTEQLAFFFAADLPSASAVARLLLKREDVEVTGVATQVSFDEGRPDLRLDLAEGFSLYLEHKFDAPLDETQLQRYLARGQVALISRRTQTIASEVLDNADYIRPVGRHYYHWEDVYRALPRRTEAPHGFGELREYFRGYMRELGLAPTTITSEWRRLFGDREIPENQQVQKQFGRLLDPVKAALSERGLRVQDRSHKGKQAYARSGAKWLHLYVEPALVRADYLVPSDSERFDVAGYEALVVELVFDRGDVAESTFNALPKLFKDPQGYEWCRIRPHPINRNRFAVSLGTPLVPLLSNEADLSSRLSQSALAAVKVLIDAAQ